MLNDHRLFFRQFRENFHTTGSIAPSSRWLSQALARYVPGRQPERRILEVGPGTGAVTRWIAPQLTAGDRLDLVEMNGEFVARLRHRFETDPALQPVADRVQIFHQAVEKLPGGRGYDAVISGLPLNNFSAELVEHLLGTLVGLLAPGGTLSFFEYVAVRPAKLLVSRGSERTRLRAIGGQLDRLLGASEFHRECVLRNLPPAWVHHVRVTPQPGV
jgi:phosphatidylethanolamine/phosphatidyl-N-methylethanolamine N-methyltransferase